MDEVQGRYKRGGYNEKWCLWHRYRCYDDLSRLRVCKSMCLKEGSLNRNSESITERRTLIKSVFTGERRSDTGAKRNTHGFEGVLEYGIHTLMICGMRGQAFLEIPGKVTFDNKILYHITNENVRGHGH